jgi:putative peptide zinc metalloprotease protein
VAKFFGSSEHPIALSDVTVNPYQKEELPSAALGWYGGGDVAVSTSDKSGKKTTESFFEVSGKLTPGNGAFSPSLLHGRSGILRLSLPPEPLVQMAYRKLRQTLQKRYKI